MTKTVFYAATLAVMVTSGPAAFAQSGNPQGMNHMQGHDMSGMDMQAMMNRCAQMRQQMRPGASMSADMRNAMAQCDQMDRQMGNGSGTTQRTR